MMSIFQDKLLNGFLSKKGAEPDPYNGRKPRAIVAILLCWLPLAILTLIDGNFWTGDIKTSFITNFDTQIRYLLALPIFILAEKMVSFRLNTIMSQFKNSGVIKKEQYAEFDLITQKNKALLSSRWLDLSIYAICYLQVFLILLFENENSFLLTWQINGVGENAQLNIAGWWNVLIGRPLVLFLFYRWFFAIIKWGFLLRKISSLDLNLFPLHPDCVGGLGFLGYSIRYFSPITFAISAGVSANLIDMILIEGLSLNDLKLPVIGFIILLTILFTYPLLWFSRKLIDAREQSVFDNDDFANGLLREFKAKMSRNYHEVKQEDLESTAYSSVSDLSSVMNNAINMKFIPLSIKDLIPLWASIIVPVLFVVLLEIPLNKLLREVFSLMI